MGAIFRSIYSGDDIITFGLAGSGAVFIQDEEPIVLLLSK